MRAAPFVLLISASLWSYGHGAELEILHINIGQGDATHTLGPSNVNGSRLSVLIDAGNTQS